MGGSHIYIHSFSFNFFFFFSICSSTRQVLKIFWLKRPQEVSGRDLLLPHVNDLADHHAGLRHFSLPQLVEEELEVAHHRHGPLPALLHPGGFGHLHQDTETHNMWRENMKAQGRLTMIWSRMKKRRRRRSDHSPGPSPRTRCRCPSVGRCPADPWSALVGRDTRPAPCPHTSRGRRSYTLQGGRERDGMKSVEETTWWILVDLGALGGAGGAGSSPPHSPSQVQPWRMSPTMREVQRLHLVGALKVFTTN